MEKIKQAIIVEGKYDKIRLENIFDTVIIVTDGFGIYKNKAKQEYIKKLGSTCGIIVLTDSDNSGMQIRKYIHTLTDNAFDIYLPQIKGREKRKSNSSSQGFLGVEGTDDKIIKDAFIKFILNDNLCEDGQFASTALLFEDGIVGKTGSKSKKQSLLKMMNLPDNLSTSDLVKILNKLYTYDEYKKMLEKSNKTV